MQALTRRDLRNAQIGFIEALCGTFLQKEYFAMERRHRLSEGLILAKKRC